MKKNTVILLLTSFVLMLNQALAASMDGKFQFYDAYIPSFFKGIETTLIKQKVPRSKINAYMSSLQGRFDRKELEKSTWPCLSKLKGDLILTEGTSCVQGWSSDFIRKNNDLMELLK